MYIEPLSFDNLQIWTEMIVACIVHGFPVFEQYLKIMQIFAYNAKVRSLSFNKKNVFCLERVVDKARMVLFPGLMLICTIASRLPPILIGCSGHKQCPPMKNNCLEEQY